MSRSPTLIAVGDNCLDVYLSKDRMAVGGNALNVAVQWMRAGLKTRYFGLVGPDPEGDVVRTALCRAGLDPDDCEVRPGSTAVTLLLERDGDRRFLLEDLGVGLGYVPEGARYAALRAADWVHLGTHSAPELVRALVRDGARFSVDVSTHHDLLDLEGVPLVFASGPEDPSERVEPLLARFRERGAQATVVTCGSAVPSSRRAAPSRPFARGGSRWWTPAARATASSRASSRSGPSSAAPMPRPCAGRRMRPPTPACTRAAFRSRCCRSPRGSWTNMPR